ncbi:MAG: hypothetical protein H0V81_15030 [Solirubrobacterales bacterium]|nr:hypothetical protein [Solirubrobacterales bacterium]
MNSPAPAESARPPWRSIAAGALLVAAVVALFLVLRSGEEDPAPPASPAATATGVTGPAAPTAATPNDLTELSKRLDRPVYWVGARPDSTYELTETDDGQLYVRYLTGGAEVGDERPDFLTVGTYPDEQALATVKKAATRKGAQSETLADGGLAVVNRARPNSWYLAYPDVGELVEVYSPRAGRARQLVRTGRIVPVARG